ncbi:MAG: hypothetical protein WCK88_00435 [bacterium]
MQHPSHRDPLDPVPKWVRRRSDTTETSEVDWWAHIPGIKRPANNSSQPSTSSSSRHQEHIPVSSVVRENVSKLNLPQPPISSSQEVSNVHRPAITGNEVFIADRLLSHPDRAKLILACSNPSRDQFLALSTPLIDRLRNIIKDETINLEHVLFLLRERLGITIS